MISADKLGDKFWKIGLTNSSKPLNLDKKIYLECFRKESFETEAAKAILKAILINLKNLTDICEKEGFRLKKTPNGISYDLPLTVIEDIFDFWVDRYRDPLSWNVCIGLLKCRSEIASENQYFSKCLKGESSKWIRQIDLRHSYRPELEKVRTTPYNPMWS